MRAASLSKISVHIAVVAMEPSSSEGDFDGEVERAALAYLDDGGGGALAVGSIVRRPWLRPS